MYLLALHPDIQGKLHQEIVDVAGDKVNFSIRLWRQYVSLLASIGAIVSLLLTSDRKKVPDGTKTLVGFLRQFSLRNDCRWQKRKP